MFWKLIGIICLFGLTLFSSTILTITAGIQHLAQLVLAWAIVFAASRLRSNLAGFAISLLAGAFLGIPASFYVYLPETGGVEISRFTWPKITEHFTTLGGLQMFFGSIVILAIAQFLLRSLMAPGATKG